MKKTGFIFLFMGIACSLFAESSVVVLGGGIGGLTSALYLARGGYEPLIIEGPNPGGLITQSASVENWPGEKKISGQQLIEKIRSQVKESGAKFLAAEVTKVDFSKKSPLEITVRHLDGSGKVETIFSSSAIVAIGSSPRFLGVEGEREYFGKGVSSCALCDGNLYQGKTVAVIGGRESAIHEALYLSSLVKEVFLIFRKDGLVSHEEGELNHLKNVKNILLVPKSKVVKIQGNKNEVTNIVVSDISTGQEKEIAVDGIFLAIGQDPNTSLFDGQLELTKEKKIFLKDHQQTSNPAVFSAGDISSPYLQAIVASGNGAVAAIQAMEYLGKKNSPQGEIGQPQEKSQKGAVLVREITSITDLEKQLLQTKIPILLEFYAPWCGPCQRLSPLLDERGKELDGKVGILKVNIQSFPDLARKYQIKNLPTLVIYGPKNGLYQRFVGSQSITDLLTELVLRKDLSLEDLCSYLESSGEGKSFFSPSSK